MMTTGCGRSHAVVDGVPGSPVIDVALKDGGWAAQDPPEPGEGAAARAACVRTAGCSSGHARAGGVRLRITPPRRGTTANRRPGDPREVRVSSRSSELRLSGGARRASSEAVSGRGLQNVVCRRCHLRGRVDAHGFAQRAAFEDEPPRLMAPERHEPKRPRHSLMPGRASGEHAGSRDGFDEHEDSLQREAPRGGVVAL